jgi:chromosome segregation protein
MHLKSIEIQGFKTFARKTELLFEPGMTAIVGPNGSGKSNLVDAIRWVLGERSARELRGSRMEEIIYSGGARRPASGMAEVRLVIDNSDGRLPVPFTEVEVMRRGYRSGESDYWLNGARCRLRDIEHLFASTGLTQQGYAVVAQDDVDFIIQTSAGERRAMIEEAAGVRGLRAQRHEAMSKLKEADMSMVRLRDLAHELGPRVDELRVQAERASSFREMDDRLAGLRGSLLRGEWLAARQRVARAETRERALDGAVAAAAAEAGAYAERYAQERTRLAIAQDARLQRERELGELRVAAGTAAGRVELLQERYDAGLVARSEAAAAVEEAERRLGELRAEEAAARLEAEASSQTGLGEEALGAIAAHQAAQERLGAATERERAASGALETLRASLQAARVRDQVVQQRRLALESAIADLGVQLEEARKEVQGAGLAGGTEVSASSELAGAARWLAQASEAAAEARRVEEDNRARVHEAAERVHRLEERVQALEMLTQGGEAPGGGARRLLELIEVPAALQAPLEAALGTDLLQSWVAEHPGDEVALAERLVEGRLEASMLLAHGGQPGVEPTRTPGGSVEALAPLLGCPAWLRPALDFLLHDTWLVDDLPAARRVAAEFAGGVAVTRGGQALCRGQLRSRPRGRVVDAQQRLRAAQAELAESREELNRASQQALSAQVAVEATAGELEAARASHGHATAHVAAEEARAGANRERLEAATARVQRTETALSARIADMDEAISAAALNASALSAAEDEVRAAESLLGVAAAELAEAREAETVLREAADGARGQRSALEAQREVVASRLARARAAVERQEAEQAAARKRLDMAGASMETLGAELAAAKSAAGVARAALEGVPAEVAGAELEELTSRIIEMEKENLERRVALAHQEEILAAARVQLEMETATLADLAGRMGDAGDAQDDGDIDWEKTQREIVRLERQIGQLGPINPLAVEEYERDSARLGGIDGQMADLQAARADLQRISDELSAEIERRFEAVFGAVAFNFQETFGTLFEGGKATLKLDDPDTEEPGVEILAQPAGKRMRSIKLLSGGERALTALAFILALEKVTPSPFYIFDEVDAPLDDANVKRFSALLSSMSEGNQFLLVTHNHVTMASARALYGVTLEDSGVSRIVSVRLRGEEVIPAVSVAG